MMSNYDVSNTMQQPFSTVGARPSQNRIRKPLTGLNFMTKNHNDESDKGKDSDLKYSWLRSIFCFVYKCVTNIENVYIQYTSLVCLLNKTRWLPKKHVFCIVRNTNINDSKGPEA